MASRKEYSWIDNIESAWYGLAKFRKQEDIPFIKDRLLKNKWRMNSLFFKLMKEFPDPSYIEVFEKIYPKQFYRVFCKERNPDLAADYINSVAVYKNPRSATILDSILNKKEINCLINPSWLQEVVAQAIWDNPCEAYAKLRKRIAPIIKELEKRPFLEVE